MIKLIVKKELAYISSGTNVLTGNNSNKNYFKVWWNVSQAINDAEEKLLMRFYELPELELYLAAFEAGANACGEHVEIEIAEEVPYIGKRSQ